MHPSARPGFGIYFTPIKCPSPGSCGRCAALNTPGTALPLSSQAACNTVFHEIMLEISRNKQKLPIRSVTLPRGAGEHTDVGRCNVSWHPPSWGCAWHQLSWLPKLLYQHWEASTGGVPSAPGLQLSPGGVWSGKPLFWAQHRAAQCCTGLTAVTGMRK